MTRQFWNSVLFFIAFLAFQAQAALPLEPLRILDALPGEYVGFDLEELGMRKEVSCRVVVARIGVEFFFKISSPGKNKVELKHVSRVALGGRVKHDLDHLEEQDVSLGRDLFKSKFVENGSELGEVELTWNRQSGVFANIILTEGPPEDFEHTLYCGGLVKVN